MVSPNINEYSWYAIYTRSRFEKKLYTHLTKTKYRAFLPLVRVKRKWHDRLKTVEIPLLPSYVFVNARKEDFIHIYSSPGFVRFIAFQGIPAKIKETEIDLLRQIVTHGKNIKPVISCCVGDLVRINDGPFKGWEGKVSQNWAAIELFFNSNLFNKPLQ